MIIASAGASLLAMLVEVGPPLQPLLLFWFLLVCPGMAFVRLLEIADHVVELTLAVALSLALDALTSETMVLARLWSPLWALLVLAGLSIAGATVQLRCMLGRDAGARRMR